MTPATEEILRLSEERWRALITAIAEIVWTTDAGGQVIEDQPGWRAFSGQTREEIRGAGWLEAIHPDSRTEAASAWVRAVAQGSLYETEWTLRRRDGESRCFSIRAAPVRDEKGVTREWIGCNTDITDRKQSEQKLLRQAREMQILKNLVDTLQACNSREEAYPFIALAATELFPGSRGALAIPVAGMRDLLVTATEWGGEIHDKGAWMKPDFPIEDCWALRRGVMHQPGTGTMCRHFRISAAGPHACLPLAVRGEVSGLISVRFADGYSLDDEWQAALSAFGNAVAPGLSTLQMRETLPEQSGRG
jgi:PAS domain S-box-containing protein